MTVGVLAVMRLGAALCLVLATACGVRSAPAALPAAPAPSASNPSSPISSPRPSEVPSLAVSVIPTPTPTVTYDKHIPPESPNVLNASRNAADLATASGGALYTVQHRLEWPDGPGAALVGLDATSIYVDGALTDGFGKRVYLERLDRTTFRVLASSSSPLPGPDIVLGAGGLWIPAGQPQGGHLCDLCTRPPASHLLVELDPSTLQQMAALTLPAPPLLAVVAGSALWVATATELIRVDPVTGRALVRAALDGYPLAMSAAPDGSRFYVSSITTDDTVGFLADFDAGSGRRLGEFQGPFISDAPPAATQDGVWINEQHSAAGTSGDTTIQLFTGPSLVPGPALPHYNFVTKPYVVGDRLWLQDDWGKATTVCADARTGKVLGTGPAIGIGPQLVVADDAGTFLRRSDGFAEDLVAITPDKRCR